MILLLHPRSTRPKNRRFPLSILSLAAVLEGREDYGIVDGNLDPDPAATMDRIMRERPARMLAVSVMPGPQMVAAMELSKQFRAKYPAVTVVWGGYFPTLYADAVLNAPYVDIAVRGQGEDTFLDLIEGKPLAAIDGISYRDAFGLHVHTKDRALRSPGEYPLLPYHRLGEPHRYIAKTFLGARTAVYQASFGCPYRCKFCGVIGMSGGRQKSETPERTANSLARLQRDYGIDSVQFYDNNFFLGENAALDLAHRLEPLKLAWWCEARIDALLRYSDETLESLKRAGCRMIFFGAESGSDEVLKEMHKQLTTAQTLELAARLRRVGIVPEFSFVIGNPQEPDRDLRMNMSFIRRLKRVNPDAEIIVQHYTPTPHPDGMYGLAEQQMPFPKTLEEWASPRWLNFTVRRDPALPWLPRRTKRLIDAFELVLACRWPTVQDTRLSRWARRALMALSSWRYALRVYRWPVELELARRLLRPRQPKAESI